MGRKRSGQWQHVLFHHSPTPEKVLYPSGRYAQQERIAEGKKGKDFITFKELKQIYA
jgi:hypothetical protein